MELKKEPVSAPAAGSVPVELVNIALVSGLGGPAVVTRRDGERLAKTGRWKIVGPAEKPVLETKGFPGREEAPPVVAVPPKPAEHAKAPAVADAKPSASKSVAFGEDHED